MASAPRSAVLGVAASLVVFLAASLFSNLALPPRGTADSLSHLDYAYQVSQGRLPETHGFYVSYDGPPSRHLERTERRQFASAHPPLFYAVASVVEGGALEDGQWPTAVARIRALNTVLGVGTLLIIAWAAWRLGGRRRAQLVIVSCALAGLVYPFVRHSADVYSDLLVTFLSTAAIALAAVALREGPRRGHVALLAVVCAAGMATKATFVITLVAVLGALAAAYVFEDGGPRWRRSGRAGLACGIVLLASIMSSGWFYLRNHEQSGSWFRSTPKAPLLGRTEMSIFDVLTSADFYLVIPRGLLGTVDWWHTPFDNAALSLAIVVVCVTALGVWLHRDQRWRAVARDRRLLLVIGLMAAELIGLQIAQLQQAVGWGGYNFRYFLPGLLPIVLLLGLGVLAFERWAGVAAAAITGLLAVGVVVNAAWYLGRGRYVDFAPDSGWVDQLGLAADSNGASRGILVGLVVVMAVGIVTVAWAITASAAEVDPKG